MTYYVLFVCISIYVSAMLLFEHEKVPPKAVILYISITVS